MSKKLPAQNDWIMQSLAAGLLPALVLARVVQNRQLAQCARPPCKRPLQAQDEASQRSLVNAHDYSCVAEGQVFVAPSWLRGELLEALRADARALLPHIPAFSEPIGERLKLELYPHRWTAPGERDPSEARAAAGSSRVRAGAGRLSQVCRGFYHYNY